MAAATAARPQLLGIPAELRISIYEELLQADVVLVDEAGVRAPQPEILRTCRQLRAEAAQMYYSNKFVIYIPGDETVLTRAWLQSTPAAHLQMIKAIHIETDESLPIDICRWRCLGAVASQEGILLARIGIFATRYMLSAKDSEGPPGGPTLAQSLLNRILWRARVRSARKAQRAAHFRELAVKGIVSREMQVVRLDWTMTRRQPRW
ncbi:hypothetical protein EJ03DRAFT_348851 [Teratosphaeria nubilosa]|uniref:Uncharacterized protein n=1 Tax=Teratosphaeria nubilosa TaxID=161662 RepID=A0A6G1LHJ3_9PEZI|nr:hypothetical protein EJ03DRAFT_348851 [Teratosphaeria nubilosa]